jgi:sulfite dehydrogenase (cytochrome) subunit A
MLNGFPLRLVVPGWYATYWVKSLFHVTVLDRPFDGFWMTKAYRIPNNPEGAETPDHLATDTVPINRFTVRSIFVRPEPDEQVAMGRSYEVEGVAFDYGSGIRQVEVSLDNGVHWRMLAWIRNSVSTRSGDGDTGGHRGRVGRTG